MKWKLLGVLLLSLLVLGSFGSASIVKDSNDKACQPVNYWVFENGAWVQKSEPRVWWYCQEPEKAKGFEGFAFKEMPYGLFKKPDPMTLHQAARDLTDLVGIDELHGKFSKNLPSYGGMFINEEKGLIFVYVKDENDKAEIRKALEKYRGKANVVFLKGKYSFEQLVKWEEKARELFKIKELEVTWLSAENSKNRLIIGLRNVSSEKLALLSEHLSALGIPKNAVIVEKIDLKPLTLEKDYKLTQSLSRYEPVRPLMGGVQFQVPGHNYCTLGFPAKRNEIAGVVTAGHCTDEGAPAYQPDTSDPSYYIGDVEVKIWSPAQGDMAWIRTTVDVSPKIYPYYTIKGYKSYKYQYVGTTVLKSGRTTGLTGGIIIDISNSLEIRTTMEVAPGDSGSPVFYWWQGQAYRYVQIYGLLYRWDPDEGTSTYVAIDDVLNNLGVSLITG
ncbi:protease [Thermococcus sp. 101 C5]|uniref:S1 family peptidase n=1 Tax=Thermococcus sp. 101 C5 TaxID=2654197 RepID=UPI00128B2FCB|nr:S1 family peptidase [Thermococcus sp. 101 C5]MPW39221.1 protease [Thermococcus sp. 101 C5]